MKTVAFLYWKIISVEERAIFILMLYQVKDFPILKMYFNYDGLTL